MSTKKWEPRKKGEPHPSIAGIFKAETLGRHPKQRECFFLLNGRVFSTYQDACRELQLLEDDNYWDLTLADAALTSSPSFIRQLFAIILTTCFPTQSSILWEKYKNYMTEDILYQLKQTNQCPKLDSSPNMYYDLKFIT
ncbi:uncharacterized protein LOC129950537 [Eupeodes corollae]|uniref:uncharacterized protein LOC129950537 n=1 Tax=Eupeodes corollae TaxID=290404 RepID=UPI002492AF1B|nr:uncharacterized protein LOC129950537 [Eupeodes corollae]